MSESREERLKRLQGAYDAWQEQTLQSPEEWEPNVDEENRLAAFQQADETDKG